MSIDNFHNVLKDEFTSDDIPYLLQHKYIMNTGFKNKLYMVLKPFKYNDKEVELMYLI